MSEPPSTPSARGGTPTARRRPAARQALGEQVATLLLEEIVGGSFLPGDLLPAEHELAEQQGVSRLTLREATGILRQKGIIEVRRGQGTYVRPRTDWSPLDPVVLRAHARARPNDLGTMENLLEARRIVEVGVAELAARRRQRADLASMRAALQRMRDARLDIDQFVEGDLGFHDALLHAAGNPVLVALFAPLRELLKADRRSTSEQATERVKAVRRHEAILAAITDRNGDGARLAMAHHLVETEAGIRRARVRQGTPAGRLRRR